MENNKKDGMGEMNKLLILLIFILPGYQWVATMHYNNLVYAIEDKWTEDEKYEIKLGFDYIVARYIIYNYPQTAMITIEKESLKKANYAKNEAWLMYFIYPRKVRYE